MQKDDFYFPHFQGARNDRKILRLRRDFGIEGYAIFFMLLEVLREQREFMFPMQDIDLLASEFNTSVAKIQTVVTAYSLFEIVENCEGKMFFSARQKSCLMPMIEKREHRRLAGKKGALAKKIKAQEQIAELSLIYSNKRKEAIANLSLLDSPKQTKQNETKREEKINTDFLKEKNDNSFLKNPSPKKIIKRTEDQIYVLDKESGEIEIMPRYTTSKK